MAKFFDLVNKYLIAPPLEIRNGTYSARYRRHFDKFQYLTPEEITAAQMVKVRDLISYAYSHCPYYRALFEVAGIRPGDIRTYEDFIKIPLLHKSDIQDHMEEMRSREFDPVNLIRNKTGGSTGEPIHFYVDAERHKTRYAATVRHDLWAGKDVGTYTANFWGHPGDIGSPIKTAWARFKDRYIYRVKFLDTSSLTDEKILAFLASLSKEKPEVFVAYSNSIYLVAEFVRTHGLKDYYKPKSIICTAEFLEESRRKVIEEVFQCKVYDRYGCRELSVIASECQAHDGLHVNADALLVEVLNNGKPVAPGEAGEVVVTDLLSRGMPFIRYRIRDVATPVEGRCACGRGLPRIKMVGGRVTDFIVTPEGKMISGASLTIFLVANAPGVKKVQIVQDSQDAVLFRVERDRDFSDATTQYLVETARSFVGPNMKIEIQLVDSIPLAPSGKNMFCKSSVNPFDIRSR